MHFWEPLKVVWWDHILNPVYLHLPDFLRLDDLKWMLIPGFSPLMQASAFHNISTEFFLWSILLIWFHAFCVKRKLHLLTPSFIYPRVILILKKHLLKQNSDFNRLIHVFFDLTLYFNRRKYRLNAIYWKIM